MTPSDTQLRAMLNGLQEAVTALEVARSCMYNANDANGDEHLPLFLGNRLYDLVSVVRDAMNAVEDFRITLDWAADGK